MKKIGLIFSTFLMILGAKANGFEPQNPTLAAVVSVTDSIDDECECATWLDECVGRWTVYVKNTCAEERTVDCWYVVELTDGTKDTRTATLQLRAGSAAFVATDFTSLSHCIEHGCSFREDQQ